MMVEVIRHCEWFWFAMWGYLEVFVGLNQHVVLQFWPTNESARSFRRQTNAKSVSPVDHCVTTLVINMTCYYCEL